jgi:hypothetical protein
MTMAEKILARHMVGADVTQCYVKPGDAVVVSVDGGYTLESPPPRCTRFLEHEYGPDYTCRTPSASRLRGPT